MIINLPNLKVDAAICLFNPERRLEPASMLRLEAEQLGIDIQWFYAGKGSRADIKYNYIDVADLQPWQNIARCHAEIVNQCIYRNYQNVLLLEDDAAFTVDFWDILHSVEIPKNFMQIQLGGFSRDLGIDNSYPTCKPALVPYLESSGLFGSILNCRTFLAMVHHNELWPTRDLAIPPQKYPAQIDNALTIHLMEYPKYFCIPPVIVERDTASLAEVRGNAHGQYHQALQEGRLFTHAPH